MRYSDVLDRLQRQETDLMGRCVVAPSQAGARLRIATGELIWECRVKAPFDGWGVFRIESDREAALVREATVHERDLWAHGRLLRRIVLLERRARGTRLGWSEDLNRSVVVRLTEGFDDYETMLTAFDGATHWSLGLDPHTHPSRAARNRERLASTRARLRETSGQRRPHAGAGDEITWRLENALSLVDATLLAWRPDGRGYLVRWRKDDREITTRVNERLDVEHAGLCLSGGDAEHDLVSLASLIDQPW